MLKKKSNILFFILLLVFSLGLLSTTYAQTSWNNIENFLQQYATNKANSESTYELAEYKTAIDRLYDIYVGNTWGGNGWATIKNYINSYGLPLQNYTYFYSDSANWIHFFTFDTQPTMTLNNNIIGLNKGSSYCIDYRFNFNNGTITKERFVNSNGADSNGKNKQYYCFFDFDNFTYPWYNIQGQNLYCTIKSTNYTGVTSTQNVASQNNNLIVDILLGQNWDSSKVTCQLIYFNDNQERVVVPINSENVSSNGYMQAIFPASTLDTDKNYSCEVYYNNYYVSRSYAIKISNGENNSGNNGNNWNSGDTLGNIINESGDTTGKVDLTPILVGMEEINNNIKSGNNQIVNAIESGNAEIVNALTNTTLESGEELTSEDIPQIEVEDISEDFFTWLLTEFLIVLNYNGNTYIDVPIYGDKSTQRIYSNEFVLTIEPLRTFISIGWWFLCGVPFLKFIRRTIEHLKGGNVPLSDDKSDLLGHVL